MGSTEVTIVNLKEVASYLKSIPESSFEATKKHIATALFEADANIKTNTELNRRSGTLMRSINTTIGGNSLASLNASIYSDCVYSTIHENGGTVKAKNAYKGVPGGPYLNIPTAENKTAAGVMRLTARMVFAQGGAIIKGKTGYGVVLGDKLMFILRKEVTIPPRLNMVKSTEDVVPTLLSRIANDIGE